MGDKVFLSTPFSEKDDAKKLGARFDGEHKKWYIPSTVEDIDPFKRWARFLNVPFAMKDEAKALGAKFDSTMKMWFIDAGVEIDPFSKWLPLPHREKLFEKKTAEQEAKNEKKEKKKKEKKEKTEEAATSSANAPPELTKIKSELKSAAPTVAEMKTMLKEIGVKGMQNKSKDELIAKCMEFKLLNFELKANKRSGSGSSSSGSQSPKKQKVAAGPPEDYYCPITSELMSDPVICSDGHSYERSAIEEWLQINNTSPNTGLALLDTSLIPNHALKAAILSWKQAND